MSRPRFGTESYQRAMFLKDRALALVQKQGRSQKTNVGRVRMYDAPEFSILFSDPATFAEWTVDLKTMTPRQRIAAMLYPEGFVPSYHLDVWALDSRGKRGKGLSIVWNTEEIAQVITFKRGDWEKPLLS